MGYAVPWYVLWPVFSTIFLMKIRGVVSSASRVSLPLECVLHVVHAHRLERIIGATIEICKLLV